MTCSKNCLECSVSGEMCYIQQVAVHLQSEITHIWIAKQQFRCAVFTEIIPQLLFFFFPESLGYVMHVHVNIMSSSC